MRFRVEQPLAVSRAKAEAALADPDFYASMGTTSKTGAPEVLALQDEGSTVRLSVRYRFTGHLAPAARAVLDPAKVTWVIESTMHRDDHRVDFRMIPDHYADRLECWGTYRLEDRGDTAVQLVEGDIVVHFPLVGRAVERAILLGLREHLAEQAQSVAQWGASGA